MKILFAIGNSGVLRQRSGVGTCHASLLSHMKTEYTLVLTKPPETALPGNAQVLQFEGVRRILYKYLRYFLPIELFVGRQDVVISDNWIPFVGRRKTVRACIVHDMMVRIYPEYYTFPQRVISELFFRRLRHADIVITVSESTRNDLCRLLGIEKERIFIVPPSYINDASPADQIGVDYKDCLLYLGDMRKNKNILRMVQGFKEFKSRTGDRRLKFLIAGKMAYEYENVRRYVEQEGLGEDVQFLGYIDEGEKRKLLGSCLALMFASEYEGFGIPVIEAFQARLPVITSNTSSLAEFGDDATFRVDPSSADEIATAIERVSNSDCRETLIRAGVRRLAEYSEGAYTAKLDKAMSSIIALAERE